MNITLKGTQVESLNFNKSEGGDDDMEFSCSVGYNNEDKKSFIVKFHISLNPQQGFELSACYIAYFETDDEIDEKFMKSNFPSINAPAIAYPFLRSFISTLTINAGYDAVLIPTLNFQALAKTHAE